MEKEIEVVARRDYSFTGNNGVVNVCEVTGTLQVNGGTRIVKVNVPEKIVESLEQDDFVIEEGDSVIIKFDVIVDKNDKFKLLITNVTPTDTQ